MKSFRTSLRICMQNIRKWSSSSRIWIIIIMSLLFVFTYTKGITLVSNNLNEKVSPWIFPFLWTYRYMKILFFMPVIFIFCDAPFIDTNQVYVMIRTKRRTWSVGQLLYIMIGSLLYILILMAATILFHFTHMQWSNQWGNVLGVAGTTNILSILNVNYSSIYISPAIINYFSPLQAIFFSVILLWLSMVLLGLLIYVVNSLTKTKLAGVTVAGFLILLTAVVDGYPKLTWFSPISWNSLNNIAIGKTSAYPNIDYVLTMYILFDVILTALALILSKKLVVEPQSEI